MKIEGAVIIIAWLGLADAVPTGNRFTAQNSKMTKPVQLIVIGGFAGSGKSTLSSRLGRTVGMPVIDLDIIVHALQKSKDFNGGPGAFFDVCVSRVADRVVPHDRVAVTAEELEEHRFKWEYITNAEIPDAIRIDATKSPESVFQEVVRSLGNRG